MASSLPPLRLYVHTYIAIPSETQLSGPGRTGRAHTLSQSLALLEEPQVFGWPLIRSLLPPWNRVLMASQVPRVSKERPARKVTLALQVLRAPPELLGLRWVVPNPLGTVSTGQGLLGAG